MDNFYVYCYERRAGGGPYYFGKGHGRRVYRQRSPKDRNRIMVWKGFTEAAAFAVERFWIGVYGRKDLGTGILINRTDGGEGLSGLIRTKEHCAKISAARKGQSPWSKGKNLSADHVRKIKAANVGQTPWNKGKKIGAYSAERILKTSIGLTGKKLSKESIEKRTATRRQNGWNKRDGCMS